MSNSDPEQKRAYEREWRRRKYAEDPDYRLRKKATDKAWRDRNAAEIYQYKLATGCKRCGYAKCASALQFHHRDPAGKLLVIGSSMQKSKARLWAEIEKCDLLCGNCHAEEHCPNDCPDGGD